MHAKYDQVDLHNINDELTSLEVTKNHFGIATLSTFHSNLYCKY